jgi:hypothetical protein
MMRLMWVFTPEVEKKRTLGTEWTTLQQAQFSLSNLLHAPEELINPVEK